MAAPVSCIVSKPPTFLQIFLYLCDCVFSATWLWQMLPLLPVQVWLPIRSLLVSAKGKRLMSPQPQGQLVLRGSVLAEPCRPSGLKGQKDRRCAAHSSHLWVSALHFRGRGSRMRKAIALLYSISQGELGARLFVAWFGNSPCAHLLLAQEHAQAGEGRG